MKPHQQNRIALSIRYAESELAHALSGGPFSLSMRAHGMVAKQIQDAASIIAVAWSRMSNPLCNGVADLTQFTRHRDWTYWHLALCKSMVMYPDGLEMGDDDEGPPRVAEPELFEAVRQDLRQRTYSWSLTINRQARERFAKMVGALSAVKATHDAGNRLSDYRRGGRKYIAAVHAALAVHMEHLSAPHIPDLRYLSLYDDALLLRDRLRLWQTGPGRGATVAGERERLFDEVATTVFVADDLRLKGCPELPPPSADLASLLSAVNTIIVACEATTPPEVVEGQAPHTSQPPGIAKSVPRCVKIAMQQYVQAFQSGCEDDDAAYAWVKENLAEDRSSLPDIGTWRRYVREGRKAHREQSGG